MKFTIVEDLKTEKYSGWAQEDIDLYEAIDWDAQGDSDYDAGCAYLDSVVLFDSDNIERANTEFHKFFKNDPYSKPYYKPIELKPFNTTKEYIGPIDKGDTHRDYPVYNQYDRIPN